MTNLQLMNICILMDDCVNGNGVMSSVYSQRIEVYQFDFDFIRSVVLMVMAHYYYK